MNFTKTVKLTKTPITCHYRGWNSFSCDHFKKSRKLLESGFPYRYFWSCMLDCRDTFWTVLIAQVCIVMHVKRYTSMRFAWHATHEFESALLRLNLDNSFYTICHSALATVNGVTGCGQREIGRFGVQDLGIVGSFLRWLVDEAERRHMTSCLSSAPSSTGYCQRRHQSVNNVKPVGFEFKIWVVDMLSVRWERSACAVALILRADIAIENSLLTRVDVRWERGACTVALVLRADILSTTFTSARSLQSKTPYCQRSSVQAGRHMVKGSISKFWLFVRISVLGKLRALFTLVASACLNNASFFEISLIFCHFWVSFYGKTVLR